MTLTRRLLLAGLALLPVPALAQGQGHGNGGGQGRGNGGGNQGGGNHGGGNHGGGGNRGRGPSLGTPELNSVQIWLGANPGFVAQPLPPGMYNRLAQGKPLPPGIARRTVPPGLLVGLPRYPGYEYAVVGTSLVLVAVTTGVVAAILSNAFGR
ncbi:anti-virulence regulator CigR family protein [Falsiroseomonas sp. HW251]|uniref:anti-virulence regulator CigR family protein n=1 Tax=Falsiroseomonas sp. HW251 TaxID=3390998 RepID=UPI003D320110